MPFQTVETRSTEVTKNPSVQTSQLDNKLEQLADELGVDLDEAEVQANTTSGFSSQTTGDHIKVKEATIFLRLDSGKETFNHTEKRVDPETGNQHILHIRGRRECPACGYIATQEGETSELARCGACHSHTCPQCQSACAACGRTLCPDCKSGHGVDENPYCASCFKTVEEQVEHERRLEKAEEMRMWQQQKEELRLKEEKQRKELELKKQEQLRKHQLKKQEEERKQAQQKFENKLKARKIALEKQKLRQKRLEKKTKTPPQFQQIKDTSNHLKKLGSEK